MAAGSRGWPRPPIQVRRRPLVLTQHGRGVAVLVDIHEFEAMRERMELLEDISVAEAQIAAGRVTPHEEAKARALAKLRS